MKFIILTEHYTQDEMYLNPSSIERMMVIHLSEKTSATQITLSTTTFTVIETPKQIIHLIKNFEINTSLNLDEELVKIFKQS
tara:strand:+ start:372 stop:617 length:246 start_codon:yes stop_codon:yes gene_type:complete